MTEHRFKEAIDACRVDSDDLSLPEMAALRQQLAHDEHLRTALSRAQEFDGKLSAALEHVEVPTGMAERILARLKDAQAASRAAHVLPGEVPGEVQPASLTGAPGDPSPHRAQRRRWLAGAAAAAVCAAVALGTAWWMRPTRMSVADLPQLADSWRQQLANEWQPIDTAPADFSVPKNITARVVGWQSTSNLAGRRSVAYLLAAPGTRDVVLFVLPQNGEQHSSIPPSRPQPISGNRSVAVWRTHGALYVLVLQGDVHQYQRLFRNMPDSTV